MDAEILEARITNTGFDQSIIIPDRQVKHQKILLSRALIDAFISFIYFVL